MGWPLDCSLTMLQKKTPAEAGPSRGGGTHTLHGELRMTRDKNSGRREFRLLRVLELARGVLPVTHKAGELVQEPFRHVQPKPGRHQGIGIVRNGILERRYSVVPERGHGFLENLVIKDGLRLLPAPDIFLAGHQYPLRRLPIFLAPRGQPPPGSLVPRVLPMLPKFAIFSGEDAVFSVLGLVLTVFIWTLLWLASLRG